MMTQRSRRMTIRSLLMKAWKHKKLQMKRLRLYKKTKKLSKMQSRLNLLKLNNLNKLLNPLSTRLTHNQSKSIQSSSQSNLNPSLLTLQKMTNYNQKIPNPLKRYLKKLTSQKKMKNKKVPRLKHQWHRLPHLRPISHLRRKSCWKNYRQRNGLWKLTNPSRWLTRQHHLKRQWAPQSNKLSLAKMSMSPNQRQLATLCFMSAWW